MPFYIERIPYPDRYPLIVTLKICWLPRYCGYSGKFLWLRKAYKLETEEYAFQDMYKVYCWVDKDTYLVKKLKGEL